MRPLSLPLLVAVLLAAGSAKGPERATVSGEVRVGGQLLESGSINFVPVGGGGPTAGAAISNGRYEIARDRGVIVGKNRVEVRGNRKTGRRVRHPFNYDEQIDELVEAVPREFNEGSTLERDVLSSNNEFNFDLPSTAPVNPVAHRRDRRVAHRRERRENAGQNCVPAMK